MEAVVAAAGTCNTLANYRLEAGARPGDSETTAAKDKQAVARERRPPFRSATNAGASSC